MIEVLNPKDLSYEKLEHIKKGLMLINPKHKEEALYQVKKWIFKKALENYTKVEDDEMIDFMLEKPRTPNDMIGREERYNTLAKAQAELIKDEKYIIQYQGVRWLDTDKIIIINV